MSEVNTIVVNTQQTLQNVIILFQRVEEREANKNLKNIYLFNPVDLFEYWICYVKSNSKIRQSDSVTILFSTQSRLL